MADNNSTARPSFYEVVFRGKPKVVRAFLTGLAMGSDTESTLFYSFTDGVFHEGKAEKFAEFVHIRATDCHVIVDGVTSALLKKLTKRIKSETGLEITSHRRIASASVKFSYQAFAARYDEEMAKAVKDLPKGLKLEDFKHEVKVDPSAKGIEAYSPAHDFEANCSGRVTGRVDLVVALRKKLDDYPLIKIDDVLLKLA